ncbi:MAG TPA: phosphoribosyl-ATP diphosphatase [Ancylobacter sp.]
MTDSIRRLHEAVVATRKGANPSPRTARLFAKGRPFIAKKVAEEAVEVALDGVMGDAPAVVRESADLLYNLVVLWVDLGVSPEDVWAEMRRREQLLGMAEKLPKQRGSRDGGYAMGSDLLAPLGDHAIETAGHAPTSRRHRG